MSVCVVNLHYFYEAIYRETNTQFNLSGIDDSDKYMRESSENINIKAKKHLIAVNSE